MSIAILKTQAKSKILSPNIDLEITQQVAPSKFEQSSNFSKSLIVLNKLKMLQVEKLKENEISNLC